MPARADTFFVTIDISGSRCRMNRFRSVQRRQSGSVQVDYRRPVMHIVRQRHPEVPVSPPDVASTRSPASDLWASRRPDTDGSATGETSLTRWITDHKGTLGRTMPTS